MSVGHAAKGLAPALLTIGAGFALYSHSESTATKAAPSRNSSTPTVPSLEKGRTGLIADTSDLITRLADDATGLKKPTLTDAWNAIKPLIQPPHNNAVRPHHQDVIADTLPTFDEPQMSLPPKPFSELLSEEEKTTFKEVGRVLKEAAFEGSRLAVSGTIGLAIIHPLTRLMLATAGRTTLKEAAKTILKQPFKDISNSTVPAPLQFFGIAFFPTVVTLSLKNLSEESEHNKHAELTQKAAATTTGGTWEMYRSAGTNASMLRGEALDKSKLIKDSVNPLKAPGSALNPTQMVAHATRNMASTLALNEGAGLAAQNITNPILEKADVQHTKNDGKTPTTVGLVLSATVASIAASVASSPFNQVFCLKTETPSRNLLSIGKEILTKPGKMALAAATRTMRTGPLVAIIIFLNEKSKEAVPNPYSTPEQEPTPKQKELGSIIAEKIEKDSILDKAKSPKDVVTIIEKEVQKIDETRPAESPKDTK